MTLLHGIHLLVTDYRVNQGRYAYYVYVGMCGCHRHHHLLSHVSFLLELSLSCAMSLVQLFFVDYLLDAFLVLFPDIFVAL
jgi:hypothetical protein